MTLTWTPETNKAWVGREACAGMGVAVRVQDGQTGHRNLESMCQGNQESTHPRGCVRMCEATAGWVPIGLKPHCKGVAKQVLQLVETP